MSENKKVPSSSINQDIKDESYPYCNNILLKGDCKDCEDRLIGLNISRYGSFLSYAGNGMQTHSTILVAIIFGLATLTIQILNETDFNNFIFLGGSIIFIEVAGLWSVYRFTKYRYLGMMNERILDNWEPLKLNSSKLAEAWYIDYKNKNRDKKILINKIKLLIREKLVFMYLIFMIISVLLIYFKYLKMLPSFIF